jgi:SAM-dependent methyltransferase
MAETNLQNQVDRMRQDWDARARENARYYVATGRELWDSDGFFESGETTVAEQILTDLTNICQGKNPKDMRVIEIGCGAGRITRALARLFGEVHAVDISGEMVEMARRAVADFPHANIYQNNGHDLTVLPDQLYDFAFSTIVFQHIPSREIVYSYVREVHRLLRPGALFKFQVQGGTVDAGSEDTWVGVSFSDEEAVEMAQACGFEPSYRHGSRDQYFWLWFRRLEVADAVDSDAAAKRARLDAEKGSSYRSADAGKLPPIFHYWSNRYVRPKLEAAGFSTPQQMFGKYLRDQTIRDTSNTGNTSNPARFASIGAGNCGFEINLVLDLHAAGCTNFVMDCFDLNPVMLERGRSAAARNESGGSMDFIQVDLNQWNPGHKYDAVIANQTLHKVSNLEGLFSQVKRSLTPNGVFIISGMIGRDGLQRSPEALAIVQEYWRRLPPSYRFNQGLQRYQEMYQNWGDSKGIFDVVRAQDILSLLVQHFHFQLFVAYANVIGPFIEPAFGSNFDAASQWDREFIDQVHERDEAEINAGNIKPTQMLAVVGNHVCPEPIVQGHLSPEFCLSATKQSGRGVNGLLPKGSGDAYEPRSWPHSAQKELEIACRRLRKSEDRFTDLNAIIEERTVWAQRLDDEIEELTARAYRLMRELAAETALVARLGADLDRLAWAGPLDRHMHGALTVLVRVIQRAHRFWERLWHPHS